MALVSSGQISFTDIVGEFGGAGSHSLSEYYPLVGQGVSGLPSSGQFSFSQFHGKDKDVVTSTWVSSGYNTTAWGANYSDGNTNWISFTSNNGNYNAGFIIGGGWAQMGSTATYYSGSYRWLFTGHGNAGTRQNQVTTFTDTSSYQNVASVASIST
tara:strand:+ start:1016 stop:1483 length:468 start_codon:yes stop_codon:yes gene_type:complete